MSHSIGQNEEFVFSMNNIIVVEIEVTWSKVSCGIKKGPLKLIVVTAVEYWQH